MTIYSKSASKSDLLLAEPFLSESIFKRSVILLTEKNKDGTVGFILNKPIETIGVSELFKDFPTFDAPIYMGGPVNQESLYYIHTCPDILKNSIPIKDNVFIGGDFETLKNGIDLGLIKKDSIRFYLGYSGWSFGQLEDELKRKSWIVDDFNKNTIFNTNDYNTLWKETLIKKGGDFSEIANFPTDPNLN